jgi:hypothetical protein
VPALVAARAYDGDAHRERGRDRPVDPAATTGLPAGANPGRMSGDSLREAFSVREKAFFVREVRREK